MPTRLRVIVTAVTATVLLAALTSGASARNLSITNQQIRSTFRSLEFSIEGVGTNRCELTLEGSLHARTIAKVVDTLLGYITRVTTAGCTLTTAILNLPWHVRYRGFSGTLPDITLLMVRVNRFSFSFGALGFMCLAEPNLEYNLDREPGGRITEIRMTAIPSMPVRSGGGFGCPASTGSFGAPNNGTVTLLGNSNDISVTLI
ncbi:MAG TPA: hypothetical protein VGO48_00565 [Conexibacter sp.]|nr:hypothetical protein [Conexibacter sp.]